MQVSFMYKNNIYSFRWISSRMTVLNTGVATPSMSLPKIVSLKMNSNRFFYELRDCKLSLPWYNKRKGDFAYETPF